MINICFISLIIGFCAGVTVITLYTLIHYHNKGVKTHEFSDNQQKKVIRADAEFLKPSKNEHAAADFK